MTTNITPLSMHATNTLGHKTPHFLIGNCGAHVLTPLADALLILDQTSYASLVATLIVNPFLLILRHTLY